MSIRSTHDSVAWSKIGVSEVYNDVERLTAPLATQLLKRVDALNSLNSTRVRVFDNGCGIGVVTNLLKKIAPDVHITATDAASGMIDTVKSRIKTQGWKHVEAAVVDSRDLADIPDNAFSHTISTFMICLAPEPDRIAQEMYRVTATPGILGLAVWADPWFSYTSDPWTKACKQLDPRYERPTVMDDSWTDAEQVKSGLQKVGFTDIVLTTERGAWEWNNSDAFMKYTLDGGNPGLQPLVDDWKALGRNVDEVRPLCRKMVEDQYGQPDGTVKGYVPAHLVTARKPDGH